tara:strand:- start:1545 stop:2378 length:834 start_codon:yes stop_codon:yes gene_type:complete
MSDTTNTASPQTAPASAPAESSPPVATSATPESVGGAQPPSTGSQGQSSFDMASWKASGSNRTELPENMRGLYDHLSDDFSKRDSFNAVKELRSMIENADTKTTPQRQGVYENQQQQQQGEGGDVERQVQARMSQMKNQESVQKFRGDFESMLKEPINVGDGHTFAFADKGELGKFVDYSRNVLNNGAISPMDLYKLYNFERILADTGEWKARQHEESMRKASGGTRSQEQGLTQQPSSNESRSSGQSSGNQTVEEIMQEKFPEIYGNMKSGTVRYG